MCRQFTRLHLGEHRLHLFKISQILSTGTIPKALAWKLPMSNKVCPIVNFAMPYPGGCSCWKLPSNFMTRNSMLATSSETSTGCMPRVTTDAPTQSSACFLTVPGRISPGSTKVTPEERRAFSMTVASLTEVSGGPIGNGRMSVCRIKQQH